MIARNARRIFLIAALALAAAGCDKAAAPGPTTSSPAPVTTRGKSVDVHQGGATFTAVLKDADNPAPTGEDGDSFFVTLSITVKSGSYVFFPSLLKYYGSNEPGRESVSAVGSDPDDTLPALVIPGEPGTWIMTYGVSASGPDGVLTFSLFDLNGTELARWR